MQAQKLIVGKAGAKRSFATKDAQSVPRPIRNTRSSTSVEQAVPDLNAGDGTNSSNDSSEPTQDTSKTSDNKPAGSLSVTEHGLKKYKRVRKFKCKECNFVGNSRSEINNHHKGSHGKCYCNTCGKACNTPRMLSRHMYSHKEDLPYPCDDCEKHFAFSGQLKQHRFKHRTVAAFPCTQCEKRFMREGELVKHIKVHENIDRKCDNCDYVTKDPRNLKQHAKIHTDDFPYSCALCLKPFRFWMQRKRHVCEGPVRSSSLEYE